MARVDVEFAADPSEGLPRARVQDEEAVLAPTEGNVWSASIETSAIRSGPARVEVVERLRSGDVVVASAEPTLSHGVFVVWTLDHEGYDEPDAYLANVEAIADSGPIPLTILFHPRVMLRGDLPDPRRAAIVRWARARATHGDEVGMHLHMQFDFVREAGVTPRTSPRWGSGRADGYDVPLTAYEEDEQEKLVRRGRELMAGEFPSPASFRGGGLFADARTLRVLERQAFRADTSARDAGSTGALKVPWTLGIDARPYRPNRDDANRDAEPRLALLEVPNTAGNTYSDDLGELRRRQRIIWSGATRTEGSAPAPATRPTVLDYVSHPSTFDAAERGRVEAVFAPLLAARADRDAGPVRFVRLVDLARLWR